MRKTFLSLLTVLGAGLVSFAQTPGRNDAIALIPAPVSQQMDAGSFTLPKNIVIEASDQAVGQAVQDLKDHLSTATGYAVSVAGSNSSATIRLVVNKTPDNALGAEGYTLSVTQKAIVIKANQPAGVFYGVQTLLQLLPGDIESRGPVKRSSWQVRCTTITDYPRFGWRGLMLDVSRHFFTKQQVKDFIDEMVKYKFNLLHMHLTDDEGWRVEIKSLPRLTQAGAWSAKRVGTFGTFPAPAPDEARDYGGFYTQDDIRELVKYAKDRYVDILPEVDIPGHSLSAIVAYPELSCTPGADKYKVRSGERIMDWHAGGFDALIDNTLCPANEKVYPFLDKVFTELAQLFPFGYIHVGGDECAKNFWEESDAVKQLMKRRASKTRRKCRAILKNAWRRS